MNDVEWLMQYLIEGDLFGFLVACFTTRLGQGFYALSSFIVSGIFYIRYQTIMVPVVLWLLLGGIFIVAMPLVSPFAVLLIVIAVSVISLKLLFGRE